jgi:hypothetical protein
MALAEIELGIVPNEFKSISKFFWRPPFGIEGNRTLRFSPNRHHILAAHNRDFTAYFDISPEPSLDSGAAGAGVKMSSS